ncbi:PD-(D/E)XK motif protein [Streptosporangiaceae bacterium NEAU-GS5]|nr:PD-(D/E)XK motif protein [Streptosporangiaceae bacterium NEAU-GS5]
MTAENRHMSLESLAYFLSSPAAMVHLISGTPELVLFLDPQRREIGLRARPTPGEPHPDTGLEYVRLRSVQRGRDRHVEVVVTEPGLFLDAYPFLCAVADRVQLQGLSLGAALDDTLRILARLLARRDTFSTEQELGLVGEIMFLLRLIRSIGPDEALHAWRGSEREEHDFSIRGHDLEVKTTSGERRTHWIGSLTQLLPTPGRPLWLISNQLTTAEFTDGHSLPDLIEMARRRLGSLSTVFDRKLGGAGWQEAYTDTCRRRWRRRAASVAFAVVEGFPSLTQDKISGVPLVRISDVSYRVDLTEQPVGAAVPEFILDVLDHGGFS